MGVLFVVFNLERKEGVSIGGEGYGIVERRNATRYQRLEK